MSEIKPLSNKNIPKSNPVFLLIFKGRSTKRYLSLQIEDDFESESDDDRKIQFRPTHVHHLPRQVFRQRKMDRIRQRINFPSKESGQRIGDCNRS